jgi:hypothetical protein
MKKLIILSVLCVATLQGFSQTGKNCFNTQFHKDATSLDPVNAYLLGYLCTMSYPDYFRSFFPGIKGYGLKGDSVKFLQSHNTVFVKYYSAKLGYLFVDKDQASGLTFASSTVATIDRPEMNQLKPSLGNLAVPVDPNVASYTVPNGQSAVFDFENECNPGGYDPEAILISTPTTIYVVFRGTDRVSCNISSLGYEWAEWMASDFKFLKRGASVMNTGIQGNVHRGMVESLMTNGFADSLASRIKRFGGANKKIWITGHSLGGAHAQLFAMFLKFNYQLSPQGVYVYESPHPGDQAFVNHLNSSIGKARIQRFEFGDDPICTLPPQVFSFARAGERNYYADYTSASLRSEQTLADDAKILCALGNLPGEQIPQTANFVFPPLCPGSACFHHPTFILQALRHALNSSVLVSLPPEVATPVSGDNCNLGDLNKAENNDIINNTATAVETTIANIVWSAGNIADNLLGSGITEGKYKLVCYGFKNNPKKYLTWNGNSGSQLNIGTSGTVFTLHHKDASLCQGLGGYQLFAGSSNMAPDVKYVAGLPTGIENTSKVLMKSKDDCIGDEETWYLFKVPNTTNVFVLYNWNSHKVLDAPDDCLTESSCPVNEFGGKSNDGTQVWILEKVSN